MKDHIDYILSIGVGTTGVLLLNDVLQTIFLLLSIVGLVANIKYKLWKKF